VVFFISSKAAGDGAAALILTNIKAPKNGYAYVYLSNESAEPVYFDNMQVTHERKQIIEENHYYSYGLKIAAISSRKLGDGSEGQLRNQYLYNDKELWEDADLNWYDYGFRNYDAQIGRFPQLDPLTDDYPELTNYQYASCEPIANIDIDGLEKGSSILYTPTKTALTIVPSIPEAIIAAAPKVIEKGAAKIGGELIKQAFKAQIRGLLIGTGTAVATAVLTLLPLKMGAEGEAHLPFNQPIVSPKPEPKPVTPPTPPKKDKRKYEQYVLIATEEGDYDVWDRGNRTPNVIQTHLKVGEVWKYGTTVRPERRYTQKWLREKKLTKVRQKTGSKEAVFKEENRKIKKYRVIHGVLPPGNKQTN